MEAEVSCEMDGDLQINEENTNVEMEAHSKFLI